MAAAIMNMSIEQSVPRETSEKFFRFFQAEVAALQQQVDRLGDTALISGERIDASEHCVAGITRLSNEVKDALVYLPARDQRTYSESIKSLQDRLQDVRATYAPRPKFSFKTARKRPSAISLSDAAQLASQQRLQVPGYSNSELPSSAESSVAPTPYSLPSPANERELNTHVSIDNSSRADKEDEDENNGGADDGGFMDADEDDEAIAFSHTATIRKPSFSQQTSIRITRHRNTHIILPASAAHATTTTGIISHLRHCIIDMSIPTSSSSTFNSTPKPFASLTLRDIKSSLVVCGRVDGPAHVTGLEDSVIVVKCRQFRMHECRRCDVYLEVGSRAVVEDCEGVRFAPMPECYVAFQPPSTTTASTNHWNQIDDFKWLKPEPSPNFSLLAESERVPDTVWTDIVPGGPALGLVEILRAVGIGNF